MKFRSGLLLGAAFTAGVVAGPVTGLLDRGMGWPVTQALAQEGGSRAETYRLLTLFGDVFERIRAEFMLST